MNKGSDVPIVSPGRAARDSKFATLGNPIGASESKESFGASGSIGDLRDRKRRNSATNASTNSMSEIEKEMQARGLRLIKHDEEPAAVVPAASVQNLADKPGTEDFVEQCKRAGLHGQICDPYAKFSNSDSMATRHEAQVLVFRIRANTKYKDAQVICVNLASKTVQYMAEQRIIKEREVTGSKVSADLISKMKFHVWFKGDAVPVEHTVYDENCRDHVVNCLKLRDPLQHCFFVCVQQGPVLKRGKSGWTHNDRYLRLVHGSVLIYRSADTPYPLDAVFLAGVEVDKKSGKSISVRSRDREIVFKYRNSAERDRWLQALDLCRERFDVQKGGIEKHLAEVRSSIAAKRSNSRNTLNHSGSHGNGMSASRSANALPAVRINNEKPAGGHYSGSLMNDEVSYSEAVDRGDRRDDDAGSNPASPRGMHDDNKVAVIPEERLGRRGSYKAGEAEVEVKVVNDAKELSIGFLQVRVDDSVSSFREMIAEELDRVPREFHFLRSFVPVGRRQEAIQPVSWIISDDTVYVRPGKPA